MSDYLMLKTGKNLHFCEQQLKLYCLCPLLVICSWYTSG